MNARIERNIRLYPWYAVGFNALFWYPVFILFFTERLTLNQALQLEAIYYLTVPILEVPSGYFSDRIGRKPTLLISSMSLLASYLLFFTGTGFAMFAIAQVCLAAGMAFNSGTDTSFHYDSLVAMGKQSEFAQREANVARNSFASTAIAAFAGGAVGMYELRWAYGLSAIAALAMVMMAILFVEPKPDGHERQAEPFTRQLRDCMAYLKQPKLLWLFVFAVLMTILNHVPYEFYQPYINLAAEQWSQIQQSTPLTSGIHTAVTMLIGAWFAARSIRMCNKLGVAKTLLLATTLQMIIIATMGAIVHVSVVVLILLRSSPGAIMRAPLNAAIAPKVDKQHRATYLSIQSLIGRLAFSGTLAVLSFSIGDSETPDAESILLALRACSIIAVAALILLILTISATREANPTT